MRRDAVRQKLETKLNTIKKKKTSPRAWKEKNIYTDYYEYQIYTKQEIILT